MPTLREVLPTYVEKLCEVEEQLLFREQQLFEKEEAIAAATADLVKREEAVQGVRQLAAERLAKIKVLEDNQEELKKGKREAEAKMRSAVAEQDRLKAVVKDLLAKDLLAKEAK